MDQLDSSLVGITGQPSKFQSKFGFRQAVHDLQELKPYAEGEWLRLEAKKENLMEINEKEAEVGENLEEEEKSTEENERNRDESEEHTCKRDKILRGPIWNYGLRKMSSDKDYYNNILFGIPWASSKTTEELILHGQKWVPSKEISSSLAVFILRKLKKMNPSSTALVEFETGRKLTYAELAQKAESLACGLHWLGVQPKQIVAIVSFHSLEAHLMVLACLLIGAVVALVNSSLNSVELGMVLRQTSPNLLFTEVGNTLSKVETAINYLEISLHSLTPQLIINSTSMPESTNYLLFHQLLRKVDPLDPTPGPRRADPLRPIMILYTGSSDNLKACLISERYCTKSMAFVESVLPESDQPSITVMITTPVYTCTSVKAVLNHYVDGHRIVLCRGQIPEPCLITALRKFEVFALLATRATLMNLLDWQARPRCPQLKFVGVTGLPLRKRNLIRVNNELFRNKVQILQLYGTVETGTLAANTFLENKEGSVGKLFYNVEMKVLEEGTRIPLGINQEGELCVRSLTMMIGYYNNPQANQEAIDSERFFHTGDLGYYDEQGFVYVTDRVREVIKWRTYLVSPSLIEALLIEQPEIKEALVLGMYDHEDGEVVTAAVLLEFDHEQTDIDALEKRVNALLPFHRKIRGGIHVFHQFPRSTLGKPMKESVHKELLDRTLTSRQKRFVP